MIKAIVSVEPGLVIIDDVMNYMKILLSCIKYAENSINKKYENELYHNNFNRVINSITSKNRLVMMSSNITISKSFSNTIRIEGGF